MTYIPVITGCRKMCHTIFFASNFTKMLNDFQNSFNDRINSKFLKSLNIWQSYEEEVNASSALCARGTVLLKDEELA